MILSTRTSYPQARSYVLKLNTDCAPRHGRLVGRLHHLPSGRQFQFGSAAELLACLAECDAAVERREGGA